MPAIPKCRKAGPAELTFRHGEGEFPMMEVPDSLCVVLIGSQAPLKGLSCAVPPRGLSCQVLVSKSWAGGGCRGGCDSLLDNWRASLHHFPRLISGQLHRDCKHALFLRENCCIWQEALLFHVYFHLIFVPIWSQNRMHLLGEAGKSWLC